MEAGGRLTRPRRKEALGVMKTHSGLELFVGALYGEKGGWLPSTKVRPLLIHVMVLVFLAPAGDRS